MPAKRKVNKEDIIDACISIIKKEGINELNARRIAKELNCSTQPLFYIYSNMDEIKLDVINKISTIFYSFVFKNNYDRFVYKDIGENYIKFAKKEPIFFKLLFDSEKNDAVSCFINLTGPAEKIKDVIASQTGLKGKDINEFHTKMWLYANGIAVLIANDICDFSDDDIEKLLGEQYMSRILFEVKNEKIDKKVLESIEKNKLIKNLS